MKLKYALTFVGLFTSLTVACACAQNIWNGGTGNWSDAANWSTGVVPNGSTVDVRIDGGNPINSVVTFDLPSGSVGTLLLDAGDALNVDGALTSYYATLSSGTLTVDLGSSFSNNGLVNNYGSLENRGTLNNNSSGTINNTGTIFNNGGTINNYGGTINNNFFYTIYTFGGTINNDSGGTINNNGRIQSAINN